MSELETLRTAIREELELLWGDLGRARGTAVKGQWSMQCDWLVERIKKLTQLVGPTPWGCIDDFTLLEDGVYQRVHAELGIEASVDMEAVSNYRARDADGRGGP